jgi:hypothetical protein
MKHMMLTLFVAVLVVAPVGTAFAQDKPAKPATKEEQAIARVRAVLGNRITTKGLDEEMPLAKLLAALEAKLPEGKKITLRIDEEGFGKQYAKIAAFPIVVPIVTNVSLRAVLRKVLNQVAGVEEVDFGIRPSGVVITRPRLAAHKVVYDVRDVVRQMPIPPPDRQEDPAQVYPDVAPTDRPGMLVHLLTELVDMRSWETIEIHNGARLVVVASPDRHDEVADLLESLRRMADTAVVMNARLYEVDRAFFTKQVAPLFATDKRSKDSPAVVRIEGPLFKRITEQKLLLEGDDGKIRPHQVETFLSRHSVFRYAAGPQPGQEGPARTRSGMAGVSFEVRPLVSPDRRFLRLKITQHVAQLVRIDKTKVLDAASGKEVEVESPNLRKTTVTGTVDIPDGGAVLMPVDCRPGAKEDADKVWLLVARPFIWIEEEERERRRTGGGVTTPQSVWDSDVPKDEEEKPTPTKPLPSTEEVKQVLQAVVTDVLTNPDVKDSREFYGTSADKTFALVDTEKLGWPKEFNPATSGYALVKPPLNPFENPRRILGIRIDKFDLKQTKWGIHDAPIEVCVFNAGGTANGSVIGGCTLYYIPKRVGKRWTVELTEQSDP